MESKLESTIDNFGGKNGILGYLKENKDIGDYILDHVLLGKGEELSQEQKIQINNFNSSQIIVRTSHSSDFYGMVDVMPTIICTKDDIDKVLEVIKNECNNEEIINYSKNEKTNYNPDEVTVSFSPYVNQVNFTLTEHPNQKGKILLDLSKEEGSGIHSYTQTQTLNFLDNVLVTKMLGFGDFIYDENQVKSILVLMEKIRELGIFSEERSLQIEGGISFLNGNTNLYQVRDFAENKYANFKVEGSGLDVEGYEGRLFGITGEKGIELPVVKKYFRNETIKNGEKLYPNGYLGFPEVITNKLSVWEQSQNMKGYIPGNSAGSSSLAHQNTRPVKEVLNNNGVAILENSFDYDIRKLKDGDVVNVKSDGINYEVIRI